MLYLYWKKSLILNKKKVTIGKTINTKYKKEYLQHLQYFFYVYINDYYSVVLYYKKIK
jgi:hypothetical protein